MKIPNKTQMRTVLIFPRLPDKMKIMIKKTTITPDQSRPKMTDDEETIIPRKDTTSILKNL